MMRSANPRLAPVDINSPARETVAMLRPYLIGLVVVTMIVALAPLQWLAVRLDWPLQRVIPVLFHRIVCALIGVHIHQRGQRDRHMPLLIVSNHVSWLDICVVSTVAPVVFVAKQEVGTWPIVSLLARLQRTVFIDRTRKMHTGSVTGTMAEHMNKGDAVVLFAEGTSTDGNRVLPFRSALLGSLRDAMEQAGRSYLQPVSIAYCRFHGIPMGRQHREVAAWFGDMDLIPHLMRVVREGAIDVEVRFGPVLEVSHTDDRKMLNRRVENIVRQLTANSLAGRPESPHVEAVPSDGETR